MSKLTLKLRYDEEIVIQIGNDVIILTRGGQSQTVQMEMPPWATATRRPRYNGGIYHNSNRETNSRYSEDSVCSSERSGNTFRRQGAYDSDVRDGVRGEGYSHKLESFGSE